MARFFRKRTAVLGKRPGEMVYIGTAPHEKAAIQEFFYDPEEFREKNGGALLEGQSSRKGMNRWINITGLSDTEALLKIQEVFDLHALTMADIVNTSLSPKLTVLESGFHLIVKMLRYDEQEELVISEQLSIIKTSAGLLTFQEQPGDVFDPVRKRLQQKTGKIRSEGMDYLVYSLLDSIVDNYIGVMQILADKIEATEEQLLEKQDESVLAAIMAHKKELLYLSKSIRPAREVLKSMMKEGNLLLSGSCLPYYHDLSSNIVQVTDTIDLYKEICTELLGVYNSAVGHKLNEIMKFLTVFSAIFLPLNLVTGIYGTNFNFIPELGFRFGYLFLWGILIGLSVIMVILFKKKKWL